MKKVGIITLNGYKNYGNRLQNYALQEAIKSIGYNVETILIDNKLSADFPEKTKTMLTLSDIPKKIIRKLTNIKNRKNNNIRTNNFKEFSRKYINETHYTISENDLSFINHSQYESFVTGSDQVWNPYYINGSPIYFLSFAPKEKRISYAASFGIANIPDEYQKNYKKYLNDIRYLSVREEQGAKIIKDLTGREAQVVVDPTMLLTKDDWRAISKESNEKPQTPYLLTYFLGEVSKTTKSRIKEIAKHRNLKIVNLANIHDVKYYTADPSEFIDFIDSAEIFCTDSFHGAVFSILLETPFIVFERKGSLPSMNSRIETLLLKFNLESRMAKNLNFDNQIYDVDYSHVNNILKQERVKAFNFLTLGL